jgi:hypothetical protein
MKYVLLSATVAALLTATSAMAQSTGISSEYLMTLYLKKNPVLGVDATHAISLESGGTVSGRVSGKIVAPSADWVTGLPGDGLRAALDARVTIETDDHEIIGMSYNGRFYCDPANADRYRKHELLKAGDCYIITAPTFQTKSEKYAWLNNVQAIGKMVEYINADHLVYDLFLVK